jgi:hypothetical protein
VLAPSVMSAPAPLEMAALAPSEMLKLVGRLVMRSGRFGLGVVVLGAGCRSSWQRALPVLGVGGHVLAGCIGRQCVGHLAWSGEKFDGLDVALASGGCDVDGIAAVVFGRTANIPPFNTRGCP